MISTAPPASLETAFTRQFGVNYPIIGAPMFLASDPGLAAAVSAAGGLGTFPAHNYRQPEELRQALRQTRRLTAQPFGINIIVQQANRRRQEQLELALEEGASLIITSLGHPGEAIRLAHQAGAKVWCDVVGLEHARKVADLGADGLVAVAAGAGGHAGSLSPLALIPLLVRRTGLPVAAAGCIVDGAGLAAALALGAAAVYLGTRLLASSEAPVAADFKQAILEAEPEQIVNTARVDGFPGNFIRNQALEAVGLQPGLLETLLSRSPTVARWLALSRAGSALLGGGPGKSSYKEVYSAGQGVGLIDAVLPVATIIEQTVREYRAIKAGLP